MSRHGQRYSSKGSNTILFHLKQQNKTISDLKRELGIGRTQIDNKVKTPSNFTLNELFTLAGYFRADVMQFVYSVYLNTSELSPGQTATLDSIVNKYSNENKTENK